MARVRLGAISATGHPGIYLISQAEVEAQLRGRLAELGGEVRWGHELVDAREQGTVTRADVRSHDGGYALTCRWLVGCDGAHSAVRDLAQIPFEGASLAESFLLADVRLGWDRSRLTAVSWLHPEGAVAAFPLPGTDVWRIIAEISDEEPAGDDEQRVGLLQTLLRTRMDDDGTRVVEATWTSRFRIHRRLAATYRGGRSLLAGDAAHIHSPMGGQGMNTGLGDAANLGWKLALVAQSRAPEQLLDTYEAERRPVAADVVKTTSTGTRFLLTRSPVLRALRDRVVLPAMRSPVAQRAAVRQMSQLGVTYRRGPLAGSGALPLRGRDAVRRRPAPGDRGPDGPCVAWPGGHRSSLFGQTRGRWALLLFDPPHAAHREQSAACHDRLGEDVCVLRVLPSAALSEPTRWAGTVLEDHHDILRARYRPARSEAVLLRPDGHIGWRSGGATQSLDAWLEGVLTAGSPGGAGLPAPARSRLSSPPAPTRTRAGPGLHRAAPGGRR